MSVNAGQTISFKVSTTASSYHIEIYRIGYYQGNGARLITTFTPTASLAQNQPACVTDATSRLYDCGNWKVSASWAVPSTATSGVYLAWLVRDDTGGDSYIPFVVRNDTSTSAVLFQTADESWQAYNGYGGHSLYGPATGFDLTNRGYKVSYNRPLSPIETETQFFYAEYPMVRWLEANGYDVTYFSSVDAAQSGSLIKNHQLYLSVGHDEYVSGPKRTNIEAALAAGVNLAFFSGNEFFWKTRWENSIDGSNTPYRTLVCYKETLGPTSNPPATAMVDPLDPPTWTGTWRDPSKSPPADGGRPENALTGQLFRVNGPGSDNTNLAIKVPAAEGKLRFWRNTAVAAQSANQTWTLPAGTLGYEWDTEEDNGSRPAGLFDLSTATYALTTDYLQDYGGLYGAGTATHHMSLYRAPSGALAFGAGTVQWSWGLDANHDGGGPGTDVNMQQATVNLFADMGIQPATLQPGLSLATKSTDTTPPSSFITSPANGAAVQAGTVVNVTGTASDTGGGIVAGVEVSTDSGATWHPASGLNSWNYTYTANKAGTFSIMSRAVDDSANLETPSAGVSIGVLGVTSLSLTSSNLSGGASTQGTVTLSAPAGTNGAVVSLSSSNSAVASVPASVTVPAGSASTTFTVSTSPVGISNSVTLSATYATTVTTSLTINPVFPPVPGNLDLDANVSNDQSASSSTIVSKTFSTTVGNELVLAMISSDALNSNMTVSSVAGAGLTWTLAVRTNAQGGTAEIWKAFAPNPLSNVSVTATFSQTSPGASITIMSFAGVDASNNGASAVGATASGSAASGAPKASLTTTRNGSWVLGVGTDYDNAVARTVGPGQILVHQAFSTTGDTFWTQIQSLATPASGTSVTINDTAPTADSYNLAILEVKPPLVGNFSISGTISPVAAGSGASVSLTGTVNQTVTADTQGNYTFTALPTGSYTVTPSQPSYVFSPASQSVTISSASASGVNFTGSTTYSLSGSITPSTAGSGASVSVTGPTTATVTANSSGTFTFPSLPNGTYTVTPSKNGFTFTPASQNATINNGNLTGVNFTGQSIPVVNVTVDAAVSNDSTTSSTSITSSPFSTTAGSELLLAFIGTDALSPNMTVSSVTGGGLTWTLVVRSNAQGGSSEIWRAFATAPLSNATVSANFSQTAPDATITVMSFTGVDSTGTNGSGAIGANLATNAKSGAPTITLTTTRNNSLVIGVGNDYDNAINRTVGTNQTMVHQFLATGAGDTYWVQRQNAATPSSGTAVRINDTAPTGDSYNLAAVEILPPITGPYSITGTISPTTGGSGAAVTLSGSASAVTSADSSGNYSFASLPNGSYTVTPSLSGYVYTPGNQPVTISGASVTGVNFTVAPLSTILSVAPAALVFTGNQGGSNPNAGTISITNAGNGALSYTTSSDSAWLTASPATGTAPQQLQISANTSGLAIGTYTGHITITASGAQNSPTTVTVVLNVVMATDWLMVDHDPARTGYSPDETALSGSTVPNLQLNWSTVVDGSVTTQPLYAHSVQVNGATHDIVMVGTAGNSLYALDAVSGAVLWKRNFGPSTPNNWAIPDGFGIEAPPVIDRVTGRVYTVPTDGTFHVLNLNDGTDVYTALTLIANPATNSVWGGLNKNGNSVYVATGSNGGDVAPWRGQVYKVDVTAAPTLTGNFVVVPGIAAPNGGGGIWGYGGVSTDQATGNVYAATAYDSTVLGNGNETTLPYSNSVIALNSGLSLLGYFQGPAPGTIPCSGAPCDLDFASTPTIFQPAGCSTMVAGGSKNGNLYLFRTTDLAVSGQPLQILNLNVPNDSLGSGGVGGVPAWDAPDNMLFITDAGPGVAGVSAGIVALNVTASCTLQVAWSKPLSGSDFPNSTPTVANGVVYVGEGNTGKIHAFNTLTGAELWASGSNYGAKSTFGAPTVTGGHLYAGSWTSYSGGGIVGAFGLPAATPILSLSSQSLSFSGTVGGTNPASQTVNITNTGNGTLSYTTTSDSAWLTASPSSGTAPQALQVSVSNTGLTAGTYTGHITVTATGAQNSPATITVTFTLTTATSGLAIDANVAKDNTSAAASITSPAFSTASSNELLLALIATDGIKSNMTVSSVTGGGLTWTLVLRTNAQGGTSEIWRAFAPSTLSNVTVTANLSQTVISTMTVLSISGVDTTGSGSGAIGATATANKASGAPTASLTTTRNNSLVLGVGNDYNNAISHTPGTGQALIHQLLATSTGDTYWMQRQNATTPLSGTSVTINDTAPTGDSYNLSIVEVRTP
ncbi:MAG TPA: N,N-dimethylformamidase beta subunit family domain-containing protein [Terriglobales bacterium]|nr:N,N-dimethylformamidase beta subunit family domain-containing protein [Terriglobales bacterium]